MADFTANGQLQDWRIAGMGSVAIQVTGTFSATLSFRASLDGITFFDLNMTPSSSPTVASSATAPGLFRVNCSGLEVFRAICTAFTSGTITAKITTYSVVGAYSPI